MAMSETDATRLEHAQRCLQPLGAVMAHHVTGTADPDRLDEGLPAGSLVVNATGMGKDRPGSPMGAARFPENGLVWEFNYRGALGFLAQARSQQAARRLTIRDGWVYFLHGWSQVIAEVFGLTIDAPRFAALARIADGLREPA
jgi:shikimate 5-dehydrogenase